jgi:hypothetical protein
MVSSDTMLSQSEVSRLAVKKIKIFVYPAMSLSNYRVESTVMNMDKLNTFQLIFFLVLIQLGRMIVILMRSS